MGDLFAAIGEGVDFVVTELEAKLFAERPDHRHRQGCGGSEAHGARHLGHHLDTEAALSQPEGVQNKMHRGAEGVIPWTLVGKSFFDAPAGDQQIDAVCLPLHPGLDGQRQGSGDGAGALA